MPNMSYCRFENTINDMWDCFENLYDTDEMSSYENAAYVRFLKAVVEYAPECKEILESHGLEVKHG